MKIRILPPWWRSGYAIIAYLTLAVLLVISIIRRRERNLINEKRKLEASVLERTAEIANQKEKLEALNAEKDKFFSILSHDLKNPFSNLYSLSELIAGNYDNLEEEEKVKILGSINKSAELIYNLLNNLLTWSRSQQGLFEYNPTTFNLTDLIQVNLNLHKVPAEAKGVILKSDLKDPVQAYGDREMINTVLRNLINNAVKFTDKGNTVEVIVSKHDTSKQKTSIQEAGEKELSRQEISKGKTSKLDVNEHKLKQQDKFIEVQVKDEGVGMTSEDLQKLFRIDVKFKSKGTKGETGTGLGLILCKEFVEKNGGRIRAESKVGEGSAFIFTIPVKEL
jgi:signal transduction histidine kinase